MIRKQIPAKVMDMIKVKEADASEARLIIYAVYAYLYVCMRLGNEEAQ